MAVVIRLKRMGRRNHPTYRIAVADSQRPTDGRTLENLGVYDPIHPRPEFREKINVERARHWLSVGAKPSHTVQDILKRAGAFEGVAAKPKRKRDGRATETSKAKRRAALKVGREQAKAVRRDARVAAKKAAAAAAGEASA
jgi:small subunit ribosomal protein S16